VVVRIYYFFGKYPPCDCIHCTPELNLAVQWSGIHYKEALGTVVSIIVAAYIPIECKPCFIQEEDEEIHSLPVLWNAPAVTASFLSSSLEKGVMQL